ncbi:MAG: hypothetical protein V1647_00375 [Pseudomonadota bacterium]
MPYIVKEQRNIVDKHVKALTETIKGLGKENRAGVLNYSISCLIRDLYDLRYSEVNEAVGMLECTKQEYYRRVAGPYEDKKVKENGDVY